jgi:hypothetical protein
MRYFFHIVDRHGIFPDESGCEHVDQEAALRHAEHIAVELAKAGELFRSSFVFVARTAMSLSSSVCDQTAVQ